MAGSHDAKRAAKKHAKEKKRQAALAARSTPQAQGRTFAAHTERAPALAAHGRPSTRSGEDPELVALLDEVDRARLHPERRAEAFRRLLVLDGLLAADGGVERFRAADALGDMGRLWLSLRVGTHTGDPVEAAIGAICRLVPALHPDDLELQLSLALEPLLFRLGRGDEALDRILLKPVLSEDDLDNATSAVLDSEFATRENILRVRDVCAAWVPAEGEGSLRDGCLEALEDALAERAER